MPPRSVSAADNTAGRRRRAAAAFVAVVTVASCVVLTGAVAPATATARKWPVPVVSHIAVTEPVVFITIDDGWTRSDEAASLIESWQWPVTSFVLSTPLRRDPAWFKAIGTSQSLGLHGRTHKSLKRMSFDQQVRAICAGARDVARLTGTRPTWLRPPYGAYNWDTVRAAKRCHMSAVVMWSVSVRGSRIGARVHAGDIILMHYMHDLPESLRVLKAKLDKLGLRPASLAEYLK